MKCFGKYESGCCPALINAYDLLQQILLFSCQIHSEAYACELFIVLRAPFR
jgi:hypothetical protein